MMLSSKASWVEAQVGPDDPYFEEYPGNALEGSGWSESGEDVTGSRTATYAGKRVAVTVRSHAELAQVLVDNPFPDAAGNRLLVVFLDQLPPSDALEYASNVSNERLALGTREIYIDYGAGMRESKLKLPAAAAGTGRNLNTVLKLEQMSRG